MRSHSYTAISPGVVIKEQIDDIGITQKELAIRMNMPEDYINELLGGDAALTPEIATKLEIALGIPAGFWNNLETVYRQKAVKIKAKNGCRR